MKNTFKVMMSFGLASAMLVAMAVTTPPDEPPDDTRFRFDHGRSSFWRHRPPGSRGCQLQNLHLRARETDAHFEP